MEIKVLGPGCPNCQDLERRVKQALAELGREATVTKVTDYAEIAKYIMSTPGVVIDEKVKHEGKPLPRVDQIKGWIEEEKKIAGTA
ncbi:MAG: thioredoxin family protein [Candidatus Margulisbacteria bacterium]|nr:thioredoxin family protein [Candidatus Margulisiibacteriota bacterium]